MQTKCLFLLILIVLGLTIATESSSGPIQSDSTKMNKEWLAIVPTGWTPIIAPLASYRASQGRLTGIWTYDDLGNSYGSFGPDAIRAALQEAWATWTVKPKWVCIVADHRSGEDHNYVLNRIGDLGIANQELGRWEPYIRGLLPLMDMDGDSLPDIAVGRIPAATGLMLGAYIPKVIQHDTDVNGRLKYRNSVMLVEDQDVAGNDSGWVRSLGDSLYENWDMSPSRTLIHHSDFPCCLAPQRQAAIDAWNTQPGMVIGMGNGSNWFELVGFWETCTTINGFNVSALAAVNSYPALLALSCGVNGTDQPVLSSCDQQGVIPLTKQLLCSSTDRGASVVIAPMRNTIQYWDFFLGKHLLMRKAANDYTWGEVLVNAMRGALIEDPSAFDHVYQFVLEGDPAAQANPGDVVAVEGDPRVKSHLARPFPSPASIGTQIHFEVAASVAGRVTICDVAGRHVRELVAGQLVPGRHVLTWDLESDGGTRVKPGVYFVQLRLSDAAFRQRVVVVR
ncbi:MAG: hypothetical protein IT435_10810 [Phycisphaerales bacterium]|nr:hypothetical protein [Phycisphaerales bacterium]